MCLLYKVIKSQNLKKGQNDHLGSSRVKYVNI